MVGPNHLGAAGLAVLIGFIGCDRSQASPPSAVSAPATTTASAAPVPPKATPTVASIASAPSAAPTPPSPPPANPALVAARPYKLAVPEGLSTDEPSPLVLFLHGYGANARIMESALGVGTVARSRHVIYALPEGTRDAHNMKFWNASDACCDFDAANTDDVAYLSAVIADAMSRQKIDVRRVYVVGYSNGGFMAHRLACELSGTIAGIASIAGAAWKDSSKCTPTHPVTVLQVHGDADKIVRYRGGHVLDKMHMQPHPAAGETVARWAALDECGPSLVTGPSVDLEDKYEGAETVKAHHDGCAKGTAVALWTVRGGNHFISQKPRAIEAVVDFLLAHPKP